MVELWLTILLGLTAVWTVVHGSVISVNNSASFRAAISTQKPGMTRILISQNFSIEITSAFEINSTREIVVTPSDPRLPMNVRVSPTRTFFVSPVAIGNLVYGAGDLNGDGFPDFISASATRWTVALRNTSLNVPINTATLPRRAWKLGDINGDGFDDVAYLADVFGRPQSQVHIVFGGQTSFNFVDVNLLKVVFIVPSEFRVQLIAPLGDINGDGLNDFAFTYTSIVRSESKGIFVGLGSATMKNESKTPFFVADPTILECASQTIIPLIPTLQSRLSVSAAGDLDGDGFGDVLIGVPPMVFVAFGTEQFEQKILRFDQSVLGAVTTNDSSVRDFGAALSGGGDFNGDSFADFAIATPSRSEVVIVLGGAIINSQYSFSTRLRTTVDKLANVLIQGRSILGCGQALAVQDFDLDGTADIVIYCATSIVTQPRRLFILYGDIGLKPNSTLNLPEWSQEILLESRIDAFDANVGDVDNDGFPDILVSNLTRTFVAFSPGKARAMLNRKQGIFSLTDAGSLTIDNVSFQGSRKLSTNVGSGSMIYASNVMCPASISANSSSCPACNALGSGISANCPLPCDGIMPSSLGYAMQARFETNLETLRMAVSHDSVITLRFDAATRSLLAFVHYPQKFDTPSTCGLSPSDGISFVVASDVHSYFIETSSETMPYAGRAAYFYDVLAMDEARGSFKFLYLDTLGRIMQSTLDLSNSRSAVQSNGPVFELPFLPFGSFSGVLKTCAASKTSWICFISVQVAGQTFQSIFSPVMVSAVGVDSPYPTSQLELYTLLPGESSPGTVMGAAIMESTFISDEIFALIYAQRDDSDNVVRRCSLMLSAFSSSDLSPIVEQVTMETFESELILKLRVVSSVVAVQLWQAAQIILYTVVYNIGEPPSLRRLTGAMFTKVLFPSSFDFAKVPGGDGSRMIFSITDVSEIRSYILDISGNGQITLLQILPSTVLPPMSSVRSSWVVPRFGISFNAHVVVDSLVQIKQNRTLDFGSDVLRHLQTFTFSGFPMLSRIVPVRLPVGSKLWLNATCPRGYFCTSDAVSACPAGSFQINDGKTSIRDCETNACAEGYYCGAGAALGSSYRRVLTKSVEALDLQMLDSSKRAVDFSFTNTDGQGTIRIRLRTSAPAWLASLRVVDTQAPLDTGGVAVRIRPGSALKLQMTLDAAKTQQSAFNATLSFEWWFENRGSERSLISVPIAVTIVPVLVVPRIVTGTLGINETFQGEVVLFNVFPTTQMRATVTLGCTDSEDPPDWLSAKLPTSEVLLQPGLGQRLPVPFLLRWNGTEGDPLSAARRHETCVRFRMVIDDVSVIEVARIQLVTTAKCPKDFFSPTGSNSASSACVPCASDSFQPIAGSVSCIPAPKCPKGTFSLRNGLRFNESSCQPCPRGSYQPLEASSTCLPCPRGQYADRQGLDACFICPEQLRGGLRTGTKEVSDCEASPGFFKLIVSQGESNKTIATQCPQGINCSIPSTLETLALYPGFWRASLNSSSIFSCRKSHYCQGYTPPSSSGLLSRRRLISGIASDTYCRAGHEGVMCEACISGYAKRGPDRVCSPCNETTIIQDQSSVAGIIVILLLVPSLCMAAILIYKRSTRKGGLSVRASSRLWECMKLVDGGTKPKLIIGLFQVVAACIANFNSSFPSAFANVARSFSIFYVDAINIIDLGCALEVARQGFYKALLITTLSPIVSVATVFAINRFSVKFLVNTEEKRRQVNVISIAVSLFTLFLVYPGVSNTVIKTFICDKFDDGRSALQADYSVACDDVWQRYVVYAGFMVVVYVAGIPLGFAAVLIKNRKSLNPNGSGPFLNKDAFRATQLRSQISKTKPLFFLVQAYIPFFYWFEPLDLTIRLVQTSVVLAFEEAWAGILFLVCVTVTYLLVLVQLAPYIKYTNHVLAILCQIAILTIGMVGLVNNLARQKVNEDATNVICFMALFGPLVIALPLHVIQIRISRFDVFFDAHEADAGDEGIDLEDSSASRNEEMLLGKGQSRIEDSPQALPSNEEHSENRSPSPVTGLRARQVEPAHLSETEKLQMIIVDPAFTTISAHAVPKIESDTSTAKPPETISLQTESVEQEGNPSKFKSSSGLVTPRSTTDTISITEKRTQSQSELNDREDH